MRWDRAAATALGVLLPAVALHVGTLSRRLSKHMICFWEKRQRCPMIAFGFATNQPTNKLTVQARLTHRSGWSVLRLTPRKNPLAHMNRVGDASAYTSTTRTLLQIDIQYAEAVAARAVRLSVPWQTCTNTAVHATPLHHIISPHIYTPSCTAGAVTHVFAVKSRLHPT